MRNAHEILVRIQCRKCLYCDIFGYDIKQSGELSSNFAS
jgi:hypothetical protein